MHLTCLLQLVSRAPRARLDQVIQLAGALRPFRGSLYSLLLSGLAEEKSLRVERLAQIFIAMKEADVRIMPSAWDVGPWRQLLRLYGRWGL